jgi:hypothetical protein
VICSAENANTLARKRRGPGRMESEPHTSQMLSVEGESRERNSLQLLDCVRWFSIPRFRDMPAEQTTFSAAEVEKFERWIREHVGAHLVPGDEGSDEGLIYNLIHELRGDGLRWDALSWKDREELEESEPR